MTRPTTPVAIAGQDPWLIRLVHEGQRHAPWIHWEREALHFDWQEAARVLAERQGQAQPAAKAIALAKTILPSLSIRGAHIQASPRRSHRDDSDDEDLLPKDDATMSPQLQVAVKLLRQKQGYHSRSQKMLMLAGTVPLPSSLRDALRAVIQKVQEETEILRIVERAEDEDFYLTAAANVNVNYLQLASLGNCQEWTAGVVPKLRLGRLWDLLAPNKDEIFTSRTIFKAHDQEKNLAEVWRQALSRQARLRHEFWQCLQASTPTTEADQLSEHPTWCQHPMYQRFRQATVDILAPRNGSHHDAHPEDRDAFEIHASPFIHFSAHCQLMADQSDHEDDLASFHQGLPSRLHAASEALRKLLGKNKIPKKNLSTAQTLQSSLQSVAVEMQSWSTAHILQQEPFATQLTALREAAHLMTAAIDETPLLWLMAGGILQTYTPSLLTMDQAPVGICLGSWLLFSEVSQAIQGTWPLQFFDRSPTLNSAGEDDDQDPGENSEGSPGSEVDEKHPPTVTSFGESLWDAVFNQVP